MSTASHTAGPWHTLEIPPLFEAVEGNQDGLSEAEARARLERFGPNKLPEQPPPAWWQILLRQFNSPLIYILGIAALVALAIGDFTDAGFISAVLAINAVIGGYQEWKAEQSSRALQQLLQIRASVERDGELREISAEEVVRGDLVWLESGGRVPADVRLLSASGLEIDESLLTGESLPVLKDPAWTGDAKAPLGDHKNMGYAGSVVIRGRGKGLVVATGVNTAVGQLAVAVAGATAGKAPLLERMHGFARLIALVVVVVATVIGVGGVLVHGVGELQSIFLFAVALAVAAIPEGLPAALTVALAIATTRMARRGVIVRRLAAVEGLGSCTLIASDKTGTLTCNELTVRQIRLPGGEKVEVTGEGFVPTGQVLLDGEPLEAGRNQALDALARAAVLCNEGDLHPRNSQWVWRGDPTDVALLAMAHKVGLRREALLDRHPHVDEIPFEPEHRFAATYHRMNGEVHVFVKGAPERVLAMCSHPPRDAQAELVEVTEAMAREGYRILALAEGPAGGETATPEGRPEPAGLRFLGFIGMIDPLRPGVQQAVARCHEAGITVCMITGDHPSTALAIARELGMASEDRQVVTGRDLEGKPPEEVEELIEHTRVFARVAPKQKLELVEAAQRAGQFVAVTGDGVNDAPALRAANIGVAMGKAGTDVAREAAELVISDDNFSTIVAGIEEGRVAYDNVRKVVAQLTATGAAEVLLVCLALAAGAVLALLAGGGGTVTEVKDLLPLLPVQLLWLNLVTNGVQGVALAFEPSEGDVLRRPPRSPNEPVFNRLMIERTIVASLVMALVGFVTFMATVHAGWQIQASRNALLLLMVLFENVHVGNNRSETKSALRLSPLRSPILLAGVVTAFLIHVAAMHFPPLQAVLQTEPIDLATWAMLVPLALTVFVAMEVHKWTWAVRYGTSYSGFVRMTAVKS